MRDDLVAASCEQPDNRGPKQRIVIDEVNDRSFGIHVGCALAKEGTPFTHADLHAAVTAGAVERVRPKMMTVVAIMAGLLPIMWNHGTGAEVMQRIAAPMIGGMISSTLLTLIVIPAIYAAVKGIAIRKSVSTLSLQQPQLRGSE
jgi:AcrB/AcrD/AcrF family